MPRLHDCKIHQLVCTFIFVRCNCEHPTFHATTQNCTTGLFLSAGPLLYILTTWAARYDTWLLIELTPKGAVFSFLLYILTKLWDGVQARLTRGVCRLGKLACSSAVPSLKQPSCKACNRFVRCASLYRLITHNSQSAQMACILHVAVVDFPRHSFHLLGHGQWDGCILFGRAAACLSTGSCVQHL